VPFVHPYNRRLPNSKYYYRQALDPAARLQKGAAINISPLVRARPALRVERHMISRKIP